MVAARVLRDLFVEGVASRNIRLLLLVPLGELVVVLGLDRLLVNHVLSTVLEELLVARDGEDLQLCRIPLLSVNLLQHVLTRLELMVVLGSAHLADKHGVRQLKVGRLILQTVHAVGVERVLSHSLSQVALHFLRQRLGCVPRHSVRHYLLLASPRCGRTLGCALRSLLLSIWPDRLLGRRGWSTCHLVASSENGRLHRIDVEARRVRVAIVAALLCLRLLSCGLLVWLLLRGRLNHLARFLFQKIIIMSKSLKLSLS